MRVKNVVIQSLSRITDICAVHDVAKFKYNQYTSNVDKICIHSEIDQYLSNSSCMNTGYFSLLHPLIFIPSNEITLHDFTGIPIFKFSYSNSKLHKGRNKMM